MADISEDNYQARYQQYVDFEEIIVAEYDLIGEKLFELINRQLGSRKTISALDVGSGTGRMPKTLLGLIKDSTLVFDYMDPVEDAHRLYEKEIPKENRQTPILNEWSSFTTEQKYDLILANNSLCGIDTSDSSMILKFKEYLTDGGLSLITLPSRESDWVQFASLLWQDVHGTPFQKTVFEDILTAAQEQDALYSAHSVCSPVNIVAPGDHVLKTVFSVMMYVDRNAIDTRYAGSYEKFKNSILSRNMPKVNFVYGVAAITK